MTHAEQHKLIIELMDYGRKMNRDDRETFDMFIKRDKDDESLDVISQKRLLALYDYYVVQKKGKSWRGNTPNPFA